MSKLRSFLLYGLISGVTAVSCGKTAVIQKIDERISDKQLTEKLMLLSNKPFDYFNAKISVDYKNAKLNQSFKTSLKMTVDSAFSGTVSYASFIIANFLADKDSLKATYKQEKCYFTEDFSYISSLLGVELEYDFFENMMLAQPIGVDTTIKYKQIKDKNKEYYILSSHRKRQYKLIEKEKINLEAEKNDDIYIMYYFSAEALELKRMTVEIPVDSVSIAINYVEIGSELGQRVPDYTTLSIVHPKDSITIGLSFSKQTVDYQKNHRFSVPDNYENCNQ